MQSSIYTDTLDEQATRQEQIETLQLQLAAWAEAAARDQAEQTMHTRRQVWGLLETHKLTQRADLMADARHAQRQAEEQASDAVADRDRAEAELKDLRLLLGDIAHGPLARRLAVAREVWALAWNTREVLSIGGRIGLDAAMAQLEILLENRDWDGRPASYPSADGDPIPAAELARPRAPLDSDLLGRVVHAARRRAVKAGLWTSAGADTPWSELVQEERALCEQIGQTLAIAGAGGAMGRTYALMGALDDVGWLLREDPHGAGAALALARIDACLAGDDAERTAGTRRRALQAVALAATELRGAIATQDEQVIWLRRPRPRVETLDEALDAYDLATANGADLVAGEEFERALDLALSDLADGDREQGAAILTLLLGMPIGDTLARRIARLLRERRTRCIGGKQESDNADTA